MSTQIHGVKNLLSEERLGLIFAIINGEHIQNIREFIHENRMKYVCSTWSVQAVWLYILYQSDDDGCYRFFKADCARAINTSPSLINHAFQVLETLGHITNMGKGPYGAYIYRIEYTK